MGLLKVNQRWKQICYFSDSRRKCPGRLEIDRMSASERSYTESEGEEIGSWMVLSKHYAILAESRKTPNCAYRCSTTRNIKWYLARNCRGISSTEGRCINTACDLVRIADAFAKQRNGILLWLEISPSVQFWLQRKFASVFAANNKMQGFLMTPDKRIYATNYMLKSKISK